MQATSITTPGKDASANTPAGRDPQKWKVAQEFETMFIHQMLKSMRATVPQDGLTKESNGRAIFTDMLDEQVSKSASKQGGFGLADQIYQQLQPGDRAPKATPDASSFMYGSYANSAMPKRASLAQVDAWTDEAAQANRLDPALLKSLVRQESGGDSLAVSSKGALGLTQLMPATARDMGVENPMDGRQNLMGGARYLRKLLDQFDGREDLAVAAYNAGPTVVQKTGGVPQYPETQNYVKRVLDGRNAVNHTEVSNVRKPS